MKLSLFQIAGYWIKIVPVKFPDKMFCLGK